MASLSILASGIGDRCFHCGGSRWGHGDRRQATESDSSRKGLILQGVRERGRAKSGSCQGTDFGSIQKQIPLLFN